MPLDVTITNQEQVLVTLNPDQPLDGDATFEVVSGNSTFAAQPGGLSAQLISEDGVGDTVYRVSGDADPGGGTQTIEDTVTLHVVHPHATTLGLSAGTPTPK